MTTWDEVNAAAAAILKSNDESFLHLLRVAGLDPKRVLPGADLRGVVFTERDDLTGLDLTGCDLRGTDLSRALGVDLAVFADVITDARTRGLPPPRPPADFSLDRVKAMILRGEAPPRAWVPFITQLSFLGEPHLTELGPLSGLSALQRLDCGNTQVSDLGPLSGLSALQRLGCGGTQVSDLGPLSGLSALQHLDCGGTRVSDLGPLSGLSALQRLACGYTQVSDLGPLSGLSALRRLDVTGAKVRDISPLRHLTNLDISGYDQGEVGEPKPDVLARVLKAPRRLLPARKPRR